MQRPTSVTVFGIINIAFAVLGLLSFALMLTVLSYGEMEIDFAADSGALSAWTTVTQWLGFIANFALLASGIGLLRMRPWGRHLAIIYAGYAIIAALISTALTVSMFGSQIPGVGGSGAEERFVMAMTIIGGLFGLGISLLHPGLLWYFMTRPNVVAAFGGFPMPTAAESSHERRPSIHSDNPYAAPETINAGPSVEMNSVGEQVLETVVPIKNRPALLSYYTGLFSLFPVFGLPLAVIAVTSGRKGLRNAKENPEVHGKAHAWIGLVCGWLFGLFNVLLIGLIVVAIVAAFTSGSR